MLNNNSSEGHQPTTVNVKEIFKFLNTHVHWPSSFKVTDFSLITCPFILDLEGFSQCTSDFAFSGTSQCSSTSLDSTTTGPGFAKTEGEKVSKYEIYNHSKNKYIKKATAGSRHCCRFSPDTTYKLYRFPE